MAARFKVVDIAAGPMLNNHRLENEKQKRGLLGNILSKTNKYSQHSLPP
jgi:hypothetical protein